MVNADSLHFQRNPIQQKSSDSSAPAGYTKFIRYSNPNTPVNSGAAVSPAVGLVAVVHTHSQNIILTDAQMLGQVVLKMNIPVRPPPQ